MHVPVKGSVSCLGPLLNSPENDCLFPVLFSCCEIQCSFSYMARRRGGTARRERRHLSAQKVSFCGYDWLPSLLGVRSCGMVGGGTVDIGEAKEQRLPVGAGLMTLALPLPDSTFGSCFFFVHWYLHLLVILLPVLA